MILWLFLTIIALAITAIIIGYFTDDEPYTPIGLFFLFIAGIILLNGQVEYATGNNITTTYTYTNNTITSTTTTVTDTLTSFNDTSSHRVGWGLAILSVIGFILNIISLTRNARNKYE